MNFLICFGAQGTPLTLILANIGKSTEKLVRQKSAISASVPGSCAPKSLGVPTSPSPVTTGSNCRIPEEEPAAILSNLKFQSDYYNLHQRTLGTFIADAQRHGLAEALRTPAARVILMDPRGRTFSQRLARELAAEKHLILLAGRYEGVDERVSTHLADETLVAAAGQETIHVVHVGVQT